jgi:hypothetical protein
VPPALWSCSRRASLLLAGAVAIELLGEKFGDHRAFVVERRGIENICEAADLIDVVPEILQTVGGPASALGAGRPTNWATPPVRKSTNTTGANMAGYQ